MNNYSKSANCANHLISNEREWNYFFVKNDPNIKKTILVKVFQNPFLGPGSCIFTYPKTFYYEMITLLLRIRNQFLRSLNRLFYEPEYSIVLAQNCLNKTWVILPKTGCYDPKLTRFCVNPNPFLHRPKSILRTQKPVC